MARSHNLILLAALGGILGVGLVALAAQNRSLRSQLAAHSASSSFELLNPVKALKINRHFIIDFSDLRKSFDRIVKKYPQKTYLYFMYLSNGGWVGVNERDQFVAASLIKVPLAMAFYKAVEDGRINLSQEYALAETDLDDGFGDLYKVGAGKSYSARDLLRIILSRSDNTAMRAVTTLLRRVGIDDPLSDVYAELGWEVLPPLVANGDASGINYSEISVKVLSNMLLALYNATYISSEHSQEILKDLSESEFNDSIPGGVPNGTIVAHKIGASANDQTFSDCGIVYVPGRPYLLCLGSNGGDQDRANRFMAEVSRAVFDFVTTH
ncbi:MAG: serine hydrolase [Candidatus Yanofskybacteria bacterium]|nr:serine hydrolase [Candidatus Yanofskybacteria bacterium]